MITNTSNNPLSAALQGYREAEFSDVRFLEIRAYSEHPEVYRAAAILVNEFKKTRKQLRNEDKYPRDAKKLIASIWLHGDIFRFTTKTTYFARGKRKQVWMTNRVLELFNCAVDLGWIEVIKPAIPPYASKKKYGGHATIYGVGEAFKVLLTHLSGKDIVNNPDLPCVVRRDADKRVIEEPDEFYQSQFYQDHQKLISSHLSRLLRSELRWSGGELISPTDLLLTRRYTQTFEKGGRWYCNFQNQPKEVRNSITIGGKPVGSLDITQCHPMLILRLLSGKQAENGLFSRHNEDVYQVSGFAHLHRDIRKKAINSLLNAPTEESAIKSLRNTHWWIDGLTGEIEIETYDSNKRRYGELAFNDIPEVIKFIDNFKLNHPDFSKYIATGIGIVLQRIDSDITYQMLKFAELINIPMIPIHEEYLVPEDKKDVIISALKYSVQVTLEDAGQFGEIKAKWTDAAGNKEIILINLSR